VRAGSCRLKARTRYLDDLADVIALTDQHSHFEGLTKFVVKLSGIPQDHGITFPRSTLGVWARSGAF